VKRCFSLFCFWFFSLFSFFFSLLFLFRPQYVAPRKFFSTAEKDALENPKQSSPWSNKKYASLVGKVPTRCCRKAVAMAFKRCRKVRYVDSVLKENEKDSELMKTVPRQKIATKLGDGRTCKRGSCYRGKRTAKQGAAAGAMPRWRLTRGTRQMCPFVWWGAIGKRYRPDTRRS
jgi:hypothetical protein